MKKEKIKRYKAEKTKIQNKRIGKAKRNNKPPINDAKMLTAAGR